MLRWWVQLVVLLRVVHGFHFTQPTYNASIFENSRGKVYLTSQDTMGIRVDDPDVKIRYKIVEGDRDNFFKAESLVVGDFSFLLVRTRTGKTDVLNRERQDSYALSVRGSVKARSGEPRKVAECAVRVTVLDKNDLKPLFYPVEYSKVVPEDTPLHQSIVKVTADDADTGINGQIYYSFREWTEQFAVHPRDGVVSLTRPLDYSEQKSYNLTVIARDRGPSRSPRTSSAQLFIQVRRVNLHDPYILVHHLPHIIEHSNADIYAIVTITDEDKGRNGEVGSLEIVEGDRDGIFRIRQGSQPNEFHIEVPKSLDREKVPFGFNLTLRATDRGNPPRAVYKTIKVDLMDTNDHAPVFDREEYYVQRSEFSPPNSKVVMVRAQDVDFGSNAEVLFSIVGGSEGGEFYINTRTGLITTAKPLDAETKPKHTLTVSALDQGNMGARKQSAAKVIIEVLDGNDNDPKFEQKTLMVSINEKQPIGTLVVRLNASDADTGENGYLSFSISNLNEVPFEIDHFTGSIRTTKVLDYESMRRKYHLKIRASDWGSPYRRQTEMSVEVDVRDVNDNRPQFEKVSCHGYVSRNAPIGTGILTLSAIDFDAGNIISYRLVSGHEDKCFSLDPGSGVVTLSCDLKDLKVEERFLNVTATDGQHFADVMTISMKLVNNKRNALLTNNDAMFECRDTGVMNRFKELSKESEKNNEKEEETFAILPSRYRDNLHQPEFLSDLPAMLTVNESVSVGTKLILMKAKDRDMGYNGKLVYAISSGNVDSVFDINMYTGALQVAGRLDREKTARYNLTVSCYDLGRPQKHTDKSIVIKVLDVNDNPPRFHKSFFNLELSENTPNGTSLLTVKATDEDEGLNGKVTYVLETDTNQFTVHPTTGVLKVTGGLDREKQEQYLLKIKASDGNKQQPLSSLAHISIKLADFNDNAPKFSLNYYEVKVPEDIPTGSVVLHLHAFDPDLLEGGQVRYAFSRGAEDKFVIDKLTGTIRLVKELDFEEKAIYNITVVARDRGSPPLQSETYILIDIVDVNENLHAPRFSDFVVKGQVEENQEPFTFVMQVQAEDQDPPGKDSHIAYSIRGGSGLGYFTINNTGHIKTLVSLDHETKDSYWLTVYAHDRGLVPLSSRLHVYIQVEDVNDNIPQAEQPVYFASVLENTAEDTLVMQVRGIDRDEGVHLTYKIVSGNPQGFFTIEESTGLITTTHRKLDRENLNEHSLEVEISDGELSSKVLVVVHVEDVNDHAPEFLEERYRRRIPEATDEGSELHMFQNDAEAPEWSPENGTWEQWAADEVDGQPLFRVFARDLDEGANADLEYSIKSGKGKGRFQIHPKTGVVYSKKGFSSGQSFELSVRAKDHGEPPLETTALVSVTVVAVQHNSPHSPKFGQPYRVVNVWESDQVGEMVALIDASDEDGDLLWYDIVGGNQGGEFSIQRDTGDVTLASLLDWEMQPLYNLTLSVTDGTHTVYSNLVVNVLDMNEHRPEFSKQTYLASLPESSRRGTTVTQVQANVLDRGKRLRYSLQSAVHPVSMRLFRVDPTSGVITTTAALDREAIHQHILLIRVNNEGVSSLSNTARVAVDITDDNDHAPKFLESDVSGVIHEGAAIGSSVMELLAIDRDKGQNAQITYSIVTGNVGNAFDIDRKLGMIRTSTELDRNIMPEYYLSVKATDGGQPPLSDTISVRIHVHLPDDAPPKFTHKEYVAEAMENQPTGTFVLATHARSKSANSYEIAAGNTDDMFIINPSSGVILTNGVLDFELKSFYSLTVKTSNMAGKEDTTQVFIHILDENDNAPVFTRYLYEGVALENTPPDTLIMSLGENSPLVVSATDPDSERNGLLSYSIVEHAPRRFFSIDSNTGAIRTTSFPLDHEQSSAMTFTVQVTDLGRPRLTAEVPAQVKVEITDVNDNPPVFYKPFYNATLLLPTYKGVSVIQLNATDQDSSGNTDLKFSIADGDPNRHFTIDVESGLITVNNPKDLGRLYHLNAHVSDGKFYNLASVYIEVKRAKNSGLVFGRERYFANITENMSQVTRVCVLNVLGAQLNEHLHFRIMNPTESFNIGSTSGVILTTGQPFDREDRDHYQLFVEVRSMEGEPRVAHTVVHVAVMDTNDNRPLFVNLPYYAVVPIDAKKGDSVIKVQAIDLDVGANGQVRYELKKGSGELFKVGRRSGEIVLKQPLDRHNAEYHLTITAIDGGIKPLSAEVDVRVKVIDRSMPVFEKQFYSATVPEDAAAHTSVLSITAESAKGRALIYSISAGNEYEEFSVDFNTAMEGSTGTCVVTVVDALDYELKDAYQLTITATDSVSGALSEVYVSVGVTDVNDNAPEFLQPEYNVTVPESLGLGAPIFQVNATDIDSGENAVIEYNLVGNSSMYFFINPQDGTISQKQALDREYISRHHLVVRATDSGTPPLSSTAHVWITVADINDNPPVFERLSYGCYLSPEAQRGQFVSVLTASDVDVSDQTQLLYAIVGGNDNQAFSIDSKAGVIRVSNVHKLADESLYVLNVSVTDGVYTSYSHARVQLLHSNANAPKFDPTMVAVGIRENFPGGAYVTTVRATDPDHGLYGNLTYYLQSDVAREAFTLDASAGRLVTRKELDREKTPYFALPLMVVDGGGRSDFTVINVNVTDVNDCNPRFRVNKYSANIFPNSTAGSTILKVQAEDDDMGRAGRVRYQLYQSNGTTASDVTSIFGIESETGRIYLKKSVFGQSNQAFQFWVRGTDGGSPSMHSDVPVDVYIMGPSDIPPQFTTSEYQFYIKESTHVGHLVTKVEARSPGEVVYEGGGEVFRVEEDGRVVLAKPVDRETQDTFHVYVVARTQTSPPLVAVATIIVRIMDENDNDPEFYTNDYFVKVPENAPVGTTVAKVLAYDRDKSHSINYFLSSPESEDIFSVNKFTGSISTLAPLDRERVPRYELQVMATDSTLKGRNSLSRVIIEVVDDNDNPPQFAKSRYQAAVNEGALPGTVVLQLTTIDRDESPSSHLELYILKGDPLAQFQVRQIGDMGELYLFRPLDREYQSSYELHITATDGKFVTTTVVSVDVLDANDNPPFCIHSHYSAKVAESAALGTPLAYIETLDEDEPENARMKAFLTGEGAQDFALSISSRRSPQGTRLNITLSVDKKLDREWRSQYHVVAHIQDRSHPDWECSASVHILVTDVNDNPPTFSQSNYAVTVPEDLEERTLITKVHASDPDLSINKKIKYQLIHPADDHFFLDRSSGVVTLAKALDREETAMFNLTIEAKNEAPPHLSSHATLLITVLDINDNPPEFASRLYSATVSEDAELGESVVRVLATSKDIGVNAEITYTIIGGNEHRHFKIHPKTGVINVQEYLDYEKTHGYRLTVQAIDGGRPPLSNQATVNITVTDVNDNTPIFIHPSYAATIREDAHIGDKLIKVEARDLDSGSFGVVSYKIIGGNTQGHFRIERDSGFILVNSQLDREKLRQYRLDIEARDRGKPSKSVTTQVMVEVEDVNDNPPMFSQPNYTAVVQEDKPVGHIVLTLKVSDADSDPNAAPFTFELHDGNEENAFRMTRDGTILTATKFNHKLRNQYVLHVRVFDNGTPILYSDSRVSIKIIEESQYPPFVTPLLIRVNSYQDDFSGGTLGRVKASDQDPYDKLSYQLVTSGNPVYAELPELFSIHHTDGTVKALPGLDAGIYQLNVSVSDGKFTSYGTVQVTVDQVTDEMLQSSVIIRLKRVGPEAFILRYKKSFIKAVKGMMGVRSKDVYILSVQPAYTTSKSKRDVKEKKGVQSGIDVLFAVRKPAGSFYPRSMIRKQIRKELRQMELILDLHVVHVDEDLCMENECQHGECIDKISLNEKLNVEVTTESSSFVSPQHHHVRECVCEQGFGGTLCERIVNECSTKPCPSYQQCVPQDSHRGYSCQCPEGYTGPHCDIDTSTCVGGACYSPRSPLSFGGRSYASYALLTSIDHTLWVTLHVRTLQPTSCLMYASGNVDYSILEIENGFLQYRFDCGSGEGLVRISSVAINDGLWHEVKLERRGNTAELILDGLHRAQGSAPGLNVVLNLDSMQVYFGAQVPEHEGGYEDIRMGFIGCVDDIRVDGLALPLHRSGANNVASLRRLTNVKFECDAHIPAIGPCGSQPCLNGGTCIEAGNTFRCSCRAPRFIGRRCELDTDPCASNPCLHDGRCYKVNNGYSCDCPTKLSGKRCEYGRHCNPNPCKNRGICEEGSYKAICKCRGFTGDYCTVDINECLQNPCMNSGTCVNIPGTFKCNCPPNSTGLYCSERTHAPKMVSTRFNITIDELLGIIGLLCVLLVLVIAFVFGRKIYVKRQNRREARSQTHNCTNELQDLKPNHLSNDYGKRNSKVSNLEMSQATVPLLPPRPISYTPSNAETTYTNVLNNFDTVRSYGSAGDDLEVPRVEFGTRNLTNTNRPIASVAPTVPHSPPPSSSHSNSDNDSINKPLWDDLKENYYDGVKITNDMKLKPPNSLPEPLEAMNNFKYTGKGAPPKSSPSTTGSPSFPGSLEQLPDYHWDCSDWVPNGGTQGSTLPNITEVPGAELQSSLPSNTSLESNNNAISGESPIDEAIETLNEDQQSEYVGDSEYNTENELDSQDFSFSPHSPNFHKILSFPNGNASDQDLGTGSESSYRPKGDYRVHPNEYLPEYSLTSEAETEDMPRPANHSNYNYTLLSPRCSAPQRYSADNGTVDRMSLSIGGRTSNASCSDLSNLCEIEESEANTDSEVDEPQDKSTVIYSHRRPKTVHTVV